jgi:Glycosyl transferase family 2
MTAPHALPIDRAAPEAAAVTDATAVAAAASRAAAAARRAPPAPPPARLSVVVPTAGRPELLMRCLHALALQTMDPQQYEIIVVDDGRCERTRALVEMMAASLPAPKLRYLRPTFSHGAAAARNIGWHAAEGSVVAFTDDDTVAMDDWLAQGAAALADDADDGVAAVAGRVVVPLPEGASSCAPTPNRAHQRGGFLTLNAFVRRRALLQTQGFDERFVHGRRADADLLFRLQDGAGPVLRCDSAVVLHPARAEPPGHALARLREAFFEPLMFAKHPQRYRDLAAPPPWDGYFIVGLTLAALWLAAAGIVGSAVVAGLVTASALLRSALKRTRGARSFSALGTALLAPYLAVYWRLRGAWHFRVWFV